MENRWRTYIYIYIVLLSSIFVRHALNSHFRCPKNCSIAQKKLFCPTLGGCSPPPAPQLIRLWGLLLRARGGAEDIDRLLQQRRANAGSATLSAYVGSWTQSCLWRCCDIRYALPVSWMTSRLYIMALGDAEMGGYSKWLKRGSSGPGAESDIYDCVVTVRCFSTSPIGISRCGWTRATRCLTRIHHCQATLTTPCDDRLAVVKFSVSRVSNKFPGKHMLKDEESARDNHVLGCTFPNIHRFYVFSSLTDSAINLS